MDRKTRMRPLRQSRDQGWGLFLLHVPAMPALIERTKGHEFAHLMRSHQSLGMIDLQSDLLRLRGRLAPGEYERYKEE